MKLTLFPQFLSPRTTHVVLSASPEAFSQAAPRRPEGVLILKTGAGQSDAERRLALAFEQSWGCRGAAVAAAAGCLRRRWGGGMH